MTGKGRAGGFSLVEAVIALLVLSVGLLGLAQLQARVFAVSAQGRTQSAALNLARQQLETLRLAIAAGAALPAAGGDAPPVQDGDRALFSREWTVSARADPAHLELRVRVGWTERDGETSAVALTTYVAPP